MKLSQEELDAVGARCARHLEGRPVIGLFILMSADADGTWTYTCQGNVKEQVAVDLLDMTKDAFLKAQS